VSVGEGGKFSRTINIPSSAFIRGNRRDSKLRDVPRAEGVVKMTNQMFWKKNEGDTVPDSLSSNSRTWVPTYQPTILNLNNNEIKRVPSRNIPPFPPPTPATELR
jgi:hypothetical protein